MRLAVLAAILLLCAAGAQAKVYKWTDAQGRVHYSANPPPGTSASEVPIAPTRPSSENPAEAPAVETDEETTPTDTAQDDENEVVRQNCQIARQNLAILEDPAIRRFREAGKEPIYYTDEQRQAKIEQARRMVAAFCDDAKP